MYNLDFFILLYNILSPFMIMNYEYNNKKENAMTLSRRSPKNINGCLCLLKQQCSKSSLSQVSLT